MVGLCFFFEDYDVDVWSGRRIDLDAWNYAAKAAGDVDRFVVVNRTAERIDTPDADMSFQVVREIPALIGRVAWVCCPWDDAVDKVPLWTFAHDVQWYVFGPASGWRTRIDGTGLYVPQAGSAALHSVHVASVVMLHRYEVLRGR